ncbi:MAG: FtsX-like permease family protein [Clostridia bacterium]|nr:FtsX-like permease family protein [Clostridia bacterium]
MKKTQFIEVLHNFKKQFVTFISIVLFVVFAMGSFIGLTWSSEAIGKTVDGYFREGNFLDYEISSAYGLNDSDVEFIKSLDDFEEAEPRYVCYDFVEKDNTKYQLRIESLGERINTPTYVDGSLPTKEDEMVIDKVFAENAGFKVGDTVDIIFDASDNNESYFTYLKHLDYDFDKFAMQYNQINQEHLKSTTFTITGIIKTSEFISVFEDTYGVNPKTGCAINGIVYVDIDAFNENAFMGYSSIMAKSNDLKEIVCFDDEYSEEIENIKTKNKTKIEEHFHTKYERYISDIQDFQDGVSEKTAEIDMQIGMFGALSQTGILLTAKKNLLLEISEYYKSVLENDFEYKCSIDGRTSNTSFCAIKTILKAYGKLRYSLCALFVIVGTLVCYFAVSRNVFEQTKLLGTKKALGMTRKEIFASLGLFSLVSTLIGIILGTVVARFVVEPVLVNALNGSYGYNSVVYTFHIESVIIFAVIELFLIIGATYLASRAILKRSANSLLTGGTNNDFKEKKYMKTKIYKKSSLLTKTIINNLFHDKRRALATIVGILGIASLIVSSFSLNNFIKGSFKEQSNNVSFYDTLIYEDSSENKNTEIKDYLNDKNIEYSEIMSTYVIMNTPDDQHVASSLFVVDDSESFLNLFNIENKNKKIDKVNGYYSSISYSEEYKVKDGGNISLTDMQGQTHEVKIDAFFNYYLMQNQFIVDRATYEKDFNESFRPNSIILKKGAVSLDTLKTELKDFEGYINIKDFYSESKKSFDGFASVFSIVVGLYIVLAVVMAFIVINNLLTMFINEKKTELTVLMINGFYKKQAKRYIYFDTIFLTIVGLILGIILGVLMGNISLKAFKTASTYMISGINWIAILYGFLITCFLTFIVSLMNLAKINKFKLGDISK